MKLRVLAGFTVVTLLSCDAARTPCLTDLDCFLGEQCIESACLVIETPDSGSDVTEIDDCRVNLGLCEPQPCNTTTGRCQPCEFDAQCGEQAVCQESTGGCICVAGYHRCGTTCVPDDADASCGTRCQPCPDVPNGVGVCEDKTCQIRCDEDWLRCDDTCEVSDLACVQCLDNRNCGAQDPVCQAGLCTACRNDADCALQLGAPVCFDGSCVECTELKKDQCQGRTCNPLTNTCSTNLIDSKRTCETCVSNDDCQGSDECVPMVYKGVARKDAYCLPLKEEVLSCSQPFSVETVRTSVSGSEPKIYCSLNEDFVTCEAYAKYGDFCVKDEDCGDPELNDGLCKLFSSGDRCTHACDTIAECRGPRSEITCVSYCRDYSN